jgi:hypothetical protein
MTKNDYIFRYRVRNWRDYNQALVARGQLTFWFDEDAIAGWRSTELRSGPGTPRIYSDTAIQCALVLKSVFHLSLRATQGFLGSVVELMKLDLPVPDYSTVSRRQGSVSVSLPTRKRVRHVVIDATGLKVYGAGEWHVQKHRPDRRRAWRKLHLGVDETTKEIVAVEVTTSSVHDSLVLPTLLEQIPGRVDQVSGDGAYDTRACYEAIHRRSALAAIPPRRNAIPWERNGDASARIRNKNLRRVRMHGRYEWRVSSGCTRQSLAENSFSRFKALFGGRLAARGPDNQYTEVMVKCAALNRMTGIGMPDSVWVR